jgi:nucleotide-binding universal stress UspA family protein
MPDASCQATRRPLTLDVKDDQVRAYAGTASRRPTMVSKPVVVGVDGSEESLLAAEWAAMEARRHGLPLRIVSAPAMLPRMRTYQACPATVANALRGVSERALEGAVARAKEVARGLEITTDLLSGPPALAMADSGADAAMLVVGARGAGGFAAMILGSVSRYAATRAECPVIVVRQASMAVHQEVAVGIRDPQDTSETLTFAFEEAAARHADLMAVHAWNWFPSALRTSVDQDAMDAPFHPEQISDEAARSLSAVLDRWREKYPGVRVRHDVIRGHPARVLANYSARVDLVVIGRHGDPGIGSIQHAVLDHARAPVAVVPSDSVGPKETS